MTKLLFRAFNCVLTPKVALWVDCGPDLFLSESGDLEELGPGQAEKGRLRVPEIKVRRVMSSEFEQHSAGSPFVRDRDQGEDSVVRENLGRHPCPHPRHETAHTDVPSALQMAVLHQCVLTNKRGMRSNHAVGDKDV